MEKLEVIATSHFNDSVLGDVTRKQRLFLDANTADRLELLGLVRPVNPTVTTASVPQQTEPPVVGGGESSASSQADQASPEMTVTEPANTDGPESPLTTHGDLPETQTLPTPVTASGGTETTRSTLRANGGRKTK